MLSSSFKTATALLVLSHDFKQPAPWPFYRGASQAL